MIFLFRQMIRIPTFYFSGHAWTSAGKGFVTFVENRPGDAASLLASAIASTLWCNCVSRFEPVAPNAWPNPDQHDGEGELSKRFIELMKRLGDIGHQFRLGLAAIEQSNIVSNKKN